MQVTEFNWQRRHGAVDESTSAHALADGYRSHAPSRARDAARRSRGQRRGLQAVWIAAQLVAILLGLAVSSAGGLAANQRSAPPAASPIATQPPVIMAAGDIACSSEATAPGAACKQQATSDLILASRPDIVLALGDNQYECGKLSQFETTFDSTWGRFKAILRPVPGNHEYNNDDSNNRKICGDVAPGAQGYWTYFGSVAHPADPTCTVWCEGYYSYDVGSWHIIALDSNCSVIMGGCGKDSPEVAWLRADLESHTSECTLAYWHHPRFSSGEHGNNDTVQPFWKALYDAGADLVLVGHDHDYERFAPLDDEGRVDTQHGIREFVVGTGGKNHYGFGTEIDPASQARSADTFGALKLVLQPDGYDWRFLPIQGETFSDSGHGQCHGAPSPVGSPAAPGTPTTFRTGTKLHVPPPGVATRTCGCTEPARPLVAASVTLVRAMPLVASVAATNSFAPQTLRIAPATMGQRFGSTFGGLSVTTDSSRTQWSQLPNTRTWVPRRSATSPGPAAAISLLATPVARVASPPSGSATPRPWGTSSSVAVATSLPTAPVAGDGLGHSRLLREILQPLVVLVSLLLSLQGFFTLWLMLYTWARTDRLLATGSPRVLLEPHLRITAILPARHEREVIAQTVHRVWNANYPKNLLEVLVVCEQDDVETIGEAQRAATEIGHPNVRVVTFNDRPINKPHGLNVALREARHDVITIFDAEDDIHPDIFQIVGTIMQRDGVGIVQAGVQLMDFQSTWFACHNVLEYFFWFKSRLHFHASVGMVPLGGNTVFMRRDLIEKVGGWDEQCLTEDADIGIRLSTLGEQIAITYDAEHATREETPPSIAQFIKQRTRWNQGFLQVFHKGDWRRYPTRPQRLLAFYTLTYPFTQAFVGLLWIPAVLMMFALKMQVGAAMLSLLPLYALVFQYVTNLVGLVEFTRAYRLRLRVRDVVVYTAGFLPYQLMLAFGAIRAVYREVRGQTNWEKTAHTGAHRTYSAPQHVTLEGD